MATTAGEITKAILQDIIVHGSESELEAVEFQDTVSAMNNYMFALDATGVSLGYTEVDDLGDTITVARGAILGIQKNVALQMISQFGAIADNTLIAAAAFGMDAMRKLSRSSTPSDFPSTLPIGQANEWRSGNWTDHFFPETENNVLTETDDNIGLESDT